MIVFSLDRGDEIGRLPPAELRAYRERSPVRGNLQRDFNDISVRSFILAGAPPSEINGLYRSLATVATAAGDSSRLKGGERDPRQPDARTWPGALY
jgi:hypothetical protein